MRYFLLACLTSLYLLLVGCNGAADGSNLINPTSTPTPTSAPISGTNVAALVVDSGPAGATGVVNIPYVTVKVCVPGSTTCVTVDHVLVDTGSTGLRLMSSALGGLALPVQNTPTGASIPGVPTAECYKFADGFIWGSVAKADLTIGGESASGVQLQVIGDSNFPTVPTGCSSGGTNEGTVADFGANGVIGVANIVHDCGDTSNVCATTANPDFYYACASGSTCQPTSMPTANQVVNPVTLFATDNNGVMIVMPAVGSSGAVTATGSLVFGIGTQSNNALSGVTQYPTSIVGDVYIGVNTVSGMGFFDTGSNLLFLPSSVAAACPSGTNSAGPDFFCPTTTVNPVIAIAGYNSSMSPSSSITLSIASANTLFASNNRAFSNVGGPNSLSEIDLGFPFNYGRSFYLGFNTNTSTNTATPGYVAF
ncbi:hypothetical protein HNQ50_003619 [Silvimonas terrae]|uniref:DUF3443 family protein n=1 Tax=Silvimonas terrae TaxID=300266 RepID=A0A840RHQ6_9NEIS|nr:DUF3443 family protein [Silvimonas terrae]MBB5192865.1 hypothetical protein [Silvimonas terrae]